MAAASRRRISVRVRVGPRVRADARTNRRLLRRSRPLPCGDGAGYSGTARSERGPAGRGGGGEGPGERESWGGGCWDPCHAGITTQGTRMILASPHPPSHARLLEPPWLRRSLRTVPGRWPPAPATTDSRSRRPWVATWFSARAAPGCPLQPASPCRPRNFMPLTHPPAARPGPGQSNPPAPCVYWSGSRRHAAAAVIG